MSIEKEIGELLGYARSQSEMLKRVIEKQDIHSSMLSEHAEKHEYLEHDIIPKVKELDKFMIRTLYTITLLGVAVSGIVWAAKEAWAAFHGG